MMAAGVDISRRQLLFGIAWLMPLNTPDDEDRYRRVRAGDRACEVDVEHHADVITLTRPRYVDRAIAFVGC